MRKLIKYECEICKELFDLEQEAIKCEKRGKEEILAPIGEKILYKNGWGNWSDGTKPNYIEMEIIDVEVCGHYIKYEIGLDGCFYESLFGNEEFNDKCKII